MDNASVLTSAEWMNWRAARAARDYLAIEIMLGVLARADRWAAIAALALDGQLALRIGWRLERVAAEHYDVLGPGRVIGSYVVLGSGETSAIAIRRAEEQSARLDAVGSPT